MQWRKQTVNYVCKKKQAYNMKQNNEIQSCIYD